MIAENTGFAGRHAAPAKPGLSQAPRLHGLAVVTALAAACALPAAALADGLFAGVWAENCSHLSGRTFTFHDGDRMKTVDLDCRIVAWKQDVNRYTSDLACVLDGAPSRAHIEVVVMGKQLRIAMGGLSQVVGQCS